MMTIAAVLTILSANLTYANSNNNNSNNINHNMNVSEIRVIEQSKTK